MLQTLEEIQMSDTSTAPRLGWLRDLPSIRDYTPDHHAVKPLLGKLKGAGARMGPAELAPSADLRAWFSPIENQLNLGSCTANAGLGLLEYCERRAFGKHIDGSRLFLYKATRNLLKWTGDTGAYLRSTMEALALFGVPPEEYWPYVVANFDAEPSAFLYSFGSNYQAVKYYRLDPSGTRRRCSTRSRPTCQPVCQRSSASRSTTPTPRPTRPTKGRFRSRQPSTGWWGVMRWTWRATTTTW